MTPDPLPSLASALLPFVGQRLADALATLVIAMVVISHGLMPWLPIAGATSAGWYRSLYAALRMLAGNYGNAAPAKLEVQSK